MTTKTKHKLRKELVQHKGCRVTIEGRIDFVTANGGCTCIVDIKINGERVKTDHLRFKLKHYLGKGDRIKFKGRIDEYQKGWRANGGAKKYIVNYGVVEAKRL